MPATGILLAIKLIDLALAGGEWAIRAKVSRDRLEKIVRTGDEAALQAAIAEAEAETDRLLADLRRPPPATPEAL